MSDEVVLAVGFAAAGIVVTLHMALLRSRGRRRRRRLLSGRLSVFLRLATADQTGDFICAQHILQGSTQAQ
jgi:hypothetical protein